MTLTIDSEDTPGNSSGKRFVDICDHRGRCIVEVTDYADGRGIIVDVYSKRSTEPISSFKIKGYSIVEQ